jgi:peptidoglycan/LPS O-acetylase OafA/YrhL
MSKSLNVKNYGRLDALDLCRGFCALGVAAYHFSMWGGTELPPLAKPLLALLGTYGVSVFFVLSGYSLAHAYDKDFYNRIENDKLRTYFRRRFGRIAPLFLVVVLASYLGKALIGGANQIEPLTIIANITMLFGFVNAAATPVIGGWSIGIEIVFYVVFPLIMLLRNWSLVVLAAATMLTAWVSAGIANATALEDVWREYVTPANHFLFFCAGMFSRLYAPLENLSKLNTLILSVALTVAATACILGATELELVTGWRRVILVTLSVVIVAIIGRLSLSGSTLRSICNLMGGVSYPLYLIHPLVFFALSGFIDASEVNWWLALIVIALTAAIIVNQYIDSPIQRRIKHLGW